MFKYYHLYYLNTAMSTHKYKTLAQTSHTHSKKYHKYITNIPQIYHKSTTKCDIVPQKCDIVPQNRVFYYKM